MRLVVVPGLVAVLVLAGCGSSGTSTTSTPTVVVRPPPLPTIEAAQLKLARDGNTLLKKQTQAMKQGVAYADVQGPNGPSTARVYADTQELLYVLAHHKPHLTAHEKKIQILKGEIWVVDDCTRCGNLLSANLPR